MLNSFFFSPLAFYLSTAPNTTGGDGGELARPPNSAGVSFDYFTNRLLFFNNSNDVSIWSPIFIDEEVHQVTINFNCTTTQVVLGGSITSYVYTYVGTGALTCSNSLSYVGVGACNVKKNATNLVASGGYFQYQYVGPSMTFVPNPAVTTGFITTSRVTTSPITTSRVTTSQLTSSSLTTSHLTSSQITSSSVTTTHSQVTTSQPQTTSLQPSSTTEEATSSAITTSFITSETLTSGITNPISDNQSTQAEKSNSILIIGAAVGAFLLVAIVGLIIFLLVLRKKRSKKVNEKELELAAVQKSQSSLLSTQRSTTMNPSDDQKEFFKNYVIPYDALIFGSKIGEGRFGEVYE